MPSQVASNANLGLLGCHGVASGKPRAAPSVSWAAVVARGRFANGAAAGNGSAVSASAKPPMAAQQLSVPGRMPAMSAGAVAAAASKSVTVCCWGLQGAPASQMLSVFRNLLRSKGRACAIACVKSVYQRVDNCVRWDVTLKDVPERRVSAARAAEALCAEARRRRLFWARLHIPKEARAPRTRAAGAEPTATRRTVGAFASLNVGTVTGKRRELSVLVSDLRVAVLALQETLRTAELAVEPLRLAGDYVAIERAADYGVPGARGLALVAARHYQLEQLSYASDFALFARVLPPAGRLDWIVATVYVPVEGTSTKASRKKALADVEKHYRAVLARFPALPVLLMGDFNTPEGRLQEIVAGWGCDASVLEFSGPKGSYRKGGRAGGLTAIDHFVANTAACRLLQAPTVVQSHVISRHHAIVACPTARAGAQGNALTEVHSRKAFVRKALTACSPPLACSNYFAALAAGDDHGDDDAPVPVPVPQVALAGGAPVLDHAHGQDDAPVPLVVPVPAVDAPAPIAAPVIAAPVLAHPHGMSDLARALYAAASKAGAYKTVMRRVGPVRYTLSPKAKALAAIRDDLAKLLRDGGHTEADHKALREAERAAVKKARAAIRADEKADQRKLVAEAVAARSTGNSRALWEKLNRIRAGAKAASRTVPAVRDSDGQLHSEPNKVLALFEAHFRSISAAAPGAARRSEEQWAAAVPLTQLSELEESINAPITWKEVVYAVRETAVGKAAGPDGLPPEALRALILSAKGLELTDDEIAAGPATHGGKALLQEVNALFAADVLPDHARCAIVVPVPKGGDDRDVNDYRGISLMNVVPKLVCGIVAQRLTVALLAAKRITPEQAGFIPGEESTGQVCALIEAIQRRMRAGKMTYAAFIDFRKAFDTVAHGALLHVAKSKGVHGRCLSFIRALYANPVLQVRVGDQVSAGTFRLEQGVRQGDPLSPILFNLFIDSILEGVPGASVHNVPRPVRGLLFADDVAALAQSPTALRKALHAIDIWAQTWNMRVNASKCGIVVFSYPGADGKPHPDAVAQRAHAKAQTFHLGGEKVEVVGCYKYLGVVIDEDLTMLEYVAHREQQGRKALFAAGKLLRATDLPLAVKRQAYLALVRPALTFGLETLGGATHAPIKALQRLQSTAVRWMLGLPRGAPCSSTVLHAELSLPHLRSVAAAAKARALTKYPRLGSVIGTLMSRKRGLGQKNMAAGGKQVQLWSSVGRALFTLRAGGRFWAGLAPSQASTLIRDRVEEATLAAGFRRQSKSNKHGLSYAALQLEATASYVHLSRNMVRSANNLTWLARARCNGFKLAYKLARAGVISRFYKNRCPACRGPHRDTLSHIIGECSAYSAARNSIMAPLVLRLGTMSRQTVNAVGSARADLIVRLAVGARSLGPEGVKLWLGRRAELGSARGTAISADASPAGPVPVANEEADSEDDASVSVPVNDPMVGPSLGDAAGNFLEGSSARSDGSISGYGSASDSLGSIRSRPSRNSAAGANAVPGFVVAARFLAIVGRAHTRTVNALARRTSDMPAVEQPRPQDLVHNEGPVDPHSADAPGGVGPPAIIAAQVSR